MDNPSTAETRPCRIEVRGLATLAMLKARHDAGVDHVDMFLPIVLDAVQAIASISFSPSDVQALVHERHGLSIPIHTLKQILFRADGKNLVRRTYGLYQKVPSELSKLADIAPGQASIRERQQKLADEFTTFAAVAGHPLPSAVGAMQLILRFLTDNQVGWLVAEPVRNTGEDFLSTQETKLVAKFFVEVVLHRDDLKVIADALLAGMTLYNTAFLADIEFAGNKFKKLRVFLDSSLILQLMGYEGDAPEAVAKETVAALTSSGAQCLVFEKTLDEVDRILAVYELHLATREGRQTLHPTQMTRCFLTKGYTPSDVRQFRALLKSGIRQKGLGIAVFPARQRQSTLDEKKLQEYLARKGGDPDVIEARVVHDVDCVAAVLTFRAGVSPVSLVDAEAVFATSSGAVVGNVTQWFRDEGQAGISPVIHIRALTGLAWLKFPMKLDFLRQQELRALCYASMQPSRRIWDKFLAHLAKLEREGQITSAEVVAVVASSLVDDMLSNVEELSADPDSLSLDDVVEKVKAGYRQEADKQIAANKEEAESRIRKAEELAAETDTRRVHAEASKAESERRELATKAAVLARADGLASVVAASVFSLLALAATAGALIALLSHEFAGGLAGKLAAVGLLVFLALELIGVLSHLKSLRGWVRGRVTRWIARAFGVES